MSRNLLADETSPYLLQHKNNPVHWRPWGAAALAAAKAADKPILLSVGYAACHWCHVMAHESFDDEGTARLMNDLFITIKVDREERPDVDLIYQSALAMLGEQGGWPLTMFLTPDGEPFWGGTYFPPQSRWGRPAFPDVLRQIAQTYHQQKDVIAKNVDALRQGLAKLSTPPAGKGLTPDGMDEAAAMALRLVDPLRGGTAGAPKFPQPVFFRLLWRAHRRTGAAMFREAVTLTLDNLCTGGIYDHLGGGFARYSTDVAWLVPHFEKMLYDNAQLVELLSEVFLHLRSPLHERCIRETIAWAMAEMRVEPREPDGTFAFASALDADSEGVEGRYYVWDAAEIDRVLDVGAAPFKAAYDVTPEGNWEGHSILNLSRNPRLLETLNDPAMAEARRRLKAARDRRIPPGRDDKVLADWNGLMIAALARAAMALGEPAWLEAARRCFDFVVTHMQVPDEGGNRPQHVWCAGSARHPAVIEDYANLARAALVLFEATGHPPYLARARTWVAQADRHHWDPAAGGYFLSADDTRDVIIRTKNATDNATPSGNGTMVEVLARLYLITGEDSYLERADRLVTVFSGEGAQHLVSVPGLLTGTELLYRAYQIVIVGDPDDPAATALRHTAWQAGQPHAVILPQHPGQPLPVLHPASGKTLVDGRPTAYVCVGRTCSLPITDADELRAHLGSV